MGEHFYTYPTVVEWRSDRDPTGISQGAAVDREAGRVGDGGGGIRAGCKSECKGGWLGVERLRRRRLSEAPKWSRKDGEEGSADGITRCPEMRLGQG